MKLRILAIASAALFVAACGSSKKSSSGAPPAAHDVSYTGPTGAVTIAAATAATTASGAYTSLSSVTGTGGMLGGLPGASAAPTVGVLDAVRAAARLVPRLAQAQVAGSTQSGSDRCDVSGTLGGSISLVDDNNPFAHTGDSASLWFSQCNNGNGEIMDGSLSIRIDATVPGTAFLNANPYQLQPGFAYAATITFTDLTYASANGQWVGMDGNITVGETLTSSGPYSLTQQISGTGLAYALGHGTTVDAGSLLTGPNGNDPYLQRLETRYTSSSFTQETAELTTINGKICSIAMGGCLSVVTVTPVYDPSGSPHPTDGLLVFRSGTGELIFDVVSVTSVDLGVDPNVTDDAGTDPTPLATIHATWACLEANTCH